MFFPRLGSLPAPQKNRHYRITKPRLLSRKGPWAHFVALGQGALTIPFLERLYLWGKKITRFPNKTMRFWVNIQAARVLTKKPANLRMGKGKGGRVGSVAKVSAGTTLLAISFLRPGLLKKFTRQISVRCPFKVGCVPVSDFLRYKQQSTNRMQRRYTSYTMLDLRYFFRRSNQAHSLAFVRELVKWSRKVPRLAQLPALNNFYAPDEYDAYYPLDTLSSFTAVKFVWLKATRRKRFRAFVPPMYAPLQRAGRAFVQSLIPETAKGARLISASNSARRLILTVISRHPLLGPLAEAVQVSPFFAAASAPLLRVLWALTLLEMATAPTAHRARRLGVLC